jgi:hypothetical protein
MLLIIVMNRNMKKKLIIYLLTTLLISCVDPSRTSTYSCSLKNNTNQSITITVYFSGAIIDNSIIEPSMSGLDCSYSEDSFTGYTYNCNFDMLKITFPNGKGYLCSQFDNPEYWFADQKTPFLPSEKFILNNNGVYEFNISEEDYINAHILP